MEQQMNLASNKTAPASLTPRLRLSTSRYAVGKGWRRRSWTRLAGVCFQVAWLLWTWSVSAATYTWTGAGFNGDQDFKWSNGFNWLGGTGPTPGEANVTLVFPNTGAPRTSTNDLINMIVNSIQFQGAGYTIHGKPGGNVLTLNANSGAFSVVATADNCQFASTCPLALGDAEGSFLVGNGGTLTVRSRLSGTGGFIKLGAGTLKLATATANTFAGSAQVDDGVLLLDGYSSSGGSLTPVVTVPGPLVIGGTDMTRHPKANIFSPDQIANSASVTVNDNGELEMTGVNDTIGALYLAGGVVDTGSGRLTLNGNVTASSAASSSITGKLSLGGTTRTFDVQGGQLNISAIISGIDANNPGLTKTGPGTLALTGGANNTYTGPTVVNGGVLALIGGARLLGGTNDGTTVTANGRLILFGAQVGLEVLNLVGGPEDTLVYAGTNSWAGPVVLTGDCKISGEGQFDEPSADLTFGGPMTGSGALRKRGGSTLHFAGPTPNTFTGGLFAEEGQLILAKDSAVTSVPGLLRIGTTNEGVFNGMVRLASSNQIADAAPISILLWSELDSGNFIDRIGNLELIGGTLSSSGTNGLWFLDGAVTNRYVPVWSSLITGPVSLGVTPHVFHCDTNSLLGVMTQLSGAANAGIIKTGPGFLSLLEANTYAGPTKVEEGILAIADDGTPGNTAAGTEVGPKGGLWLHRSTVIGEALSIDGSGTNAWSVTADQTNIWRGNVTITGAPTLRTVETNSHLAIEGAIAGSGGLQIDGPGAMVFGGFTTNTYTGTTLVRRGTLLLDKQHSFLSHPYAIPGDLTIGGTNFYEPAVVRWLGNGQLNSGNPIWKNTVRVEPSGEMDLNGHSETVGELVLRVGRVLTGNGSLALLGNIEVEPFEAYITSVYGHLFLAQGFGNGTHTFDVQAGAYLDISADISESLLDSEAANIIKSGPGQLSLYRSNHFTGTFTAQSGWISVGHAHALGTTDQGTEVQPGAFLYLTRSMTNAEPMFLSGPGYSDWSTVYTTSNCTLLGAITLSGDVRVSPALADASITLAGPISGPGSLKKVGEGRLILAGNQANTYVGATRVEGGTLELAKTNAVAIPGPLAAGMDTIVRYLKPHQIADLSPVVAEAGSQLRLIGQDDTIGSLAGDGLVELLGARLITGGNDASTSFGGPISGIGGGLTKAGSGVFTLTGTNAYTGTTFAKGGTLMVRGQQPWSDVTIQTGGTLAGDGVVGAIADLTGNVKPGANCGALKCGGFLTHAPNNIFQIEINGIIPGVTHDQLDVAGNVSLAGGQLQVLMNTSGAVSNQYVIVKIAGTESATGNFTGLPEGSSVVASNGVTLRITYHGGDGNDIALIQQAPEGPKVGKIEKLSGGSIKISAQGQPNTAYSVEATTSLNTPIQWTVLGAVTANAAGEFSFTDPDAVQHPVRFYRFVQQ